MKSNTLAAAGGRRQPGSRTEPLGANSEIGRKLKQYYDDLVSEEVPDRFADLLRQLDESTKSAPARDGE